MRSIKAFPASCHPDRDNLAALLALAAYVTAALDVETDEQVTTRLQRLRDCIGAAKACGMLTDIIDPAIEGMIQAVEAIRAERPDEMAFAAAADALTQHVVPAEPTRAMEVAGVRAGAGSVDAARRIFAAMLSAGSR